jgi:6-pyruvoyl-tetrahydropterin synthase
MRSTKVISKWLERTETRVYNHHDSEDRLNQQVHEKLDHAVHNRKWREAERLPIRESQRKIQKMTQGLPKCSSLLQLYKRDKRKISLQAKLSCLCKTYRIEALRQCCKANVSFGMLERFMGFVDQNSGSGLSIGCAKDLPRTIDPVLLIDEMKRLRAIIQGCYPAIATISDGTLAGAEIEAVKVWMVRRKDYKIIELLARIKLYGKKLKGEFTEYFVLF